MLGSKGIEKLNQITLILYLQNAQFKTFFDQLGAFFILYICLTILQV